MINPQSSSDVTKSKLVFQQNPSIKAQTTTAEKLQRSKIDARNQYIYNLETKLKRGNTQEGVELYPKNISADFEFGF